ncbi:2OG-Fe(II) oxygenase [Yunchengibacter salinarum]|uniref:2OG-Fe(II) oxygenase n=1 Tax=Yunchengibacter salinarum TaxID=3133399 RepID=UPI0035B5FA1F
MQFALNPHLDTDALSRQYRERQRLQVRDIFTTETAEAITQTLEHQVPWAFVHQDGDRARYYRAEEMAAMSAEDQRALMARLYDGARKGYQFAYNTYPMLDAYLEKWRQVPLLDQLLEFINSPEMLDFIRRLTSRPDIIKGDAQATRYGAGQFLKKHDDRLDSEYRVAAYVLNFTRHWEPDWGGFLQFYDHEGDIEQGFLPRFNALNIFTVPQEHSVSPVAHYVPHQHQRYAITGWFRYR